MYITVLPSLSPALLHGPSKDGLRRATAHAQGFYRHGRDALHAGLVHAGLSRGDVVLMPASMCDVVLRAFVHSAIPMRLYDRNPVVAPSPEDLSRLLCSRTRAIYVNHDFGVETDFSAIRAFCTERNLLLIEDCAHLLPGRSSHAGTWGDFSLFSPRKLLPLPDGGALRLNRLPSPSHEAEGAADIAGVVKLLAGHLALKGLLPIATLKARRGAVEDLLQLNPDVSSASWEAPRAISRTSVVIANRHDVDDVVAARLQNYRLAHVWALQLGDAAKPLYPEPPERSAPFSFPLVCEQRDVFVRAAAAQGIYLEPTYNPPYRTVPGLVNPEDAFAFSEQLARKVVSIPVHQSLSPPLMHRVLKLLDKSLRS